MECRIKKELDRHEQQQGNKEIHWNDVLKEARQNGDADKAKQTLAAMLVQDNAKNDPEFLAEFPVLEHINDPAKVVDDLMFKDFRAVRSALCQAVQEIDLQSITDNISDRAMSQAEDLIEMNPSLIDDLIREPQNTEAMLKKVQSPMRVIY